MIISIFRLKEQLTFVLKFNEIKREII
jgi:hypothetical protein